ncbi:MAG: MFS transporter [Fibrobacteraceae bacterium]|nr:MFS transporter [Fibrobacteraceae bacterium]
MESETKALSNKSALPLVLGFMGFWANGDNYAAAPLLPSIAADLGISISRAGLTVTAYMLSFGLFTILFGPLSDKFGKGRVIKTAAFGTSLFSILGGLSFNFESLVLFRAMNGMFGAGIFPVTMALIGSEFGDRERQGALAKVMGLGFLGGASATVIGGTLAQVGSWRTVYILYGIAELVLSFFVLRLVPNGTIAKDKFNLFKSYGMAFKNHRLVLLVSILFGVGFSVFGTFSYSGFYAQSITHLPIILVGLIVAAFGIGTVTSSKFISVFQARLGLKQLPCAGLIGFASLLALVLATTFVQIAVPLLVIGFYGFGLAFVIIQSTAAMTAQGLLPGLRGTVMSMVSFAMFVGGGIGTTVNGLIIASGYIRFMYAIAAVLIFSVALCLWRILKRIQLEKTSK